MESRPLPNILETCRNRAKLAAMTDTAPVNVLLVEDVLSEKMLTRIALDASGVPYQLKTLQKGTEVVPYLQANAAEILLLDIGLPDIDGFAVLSELMEQPYELRTIPIVILTGYKNFADIKKKYPLNIIAYINKPCNPQEMHDALLQARKPR